MSYHAKVSAGGKIVVPAEVRRQLNVRDGDTVVFEQEDGKLVFKSYLQVVREVQASFKAMMREPDSVDDFLAWRREEAAKENME